MLDLTLFKKPGLTAGSGSLAMMTFTMYGALFALTLYLQFVKCYSPMETGLCFLPVAVGYALGSVASSKNALRWGTKTVVSAGFAGTALAALAVAFWKISTPFWLIGLNIVLLSFCHGNIMAPSLNSVLGSLPKKMAGVGSAIGNISFQVGGALGVAVLGSVLGSIYRLRIDEALNAAAGFPQQLTGGARESVGAAIILAGSLPGETGEKLLSLAQQGFMGAWLAAFPAICAVGATGLVFALKFMPRHVVPEQS
jgi:predicted MFS family arabinose efflux permease